MARATAVAEQIEDEVGQVQAVKGQLVERRGRFADARAGKSSLLARTRAGASVSKGQVIGAVGNTGRSFGAHLHFETRSGGTPVDPLGYL